MKKWQRRLILIVALVLLLVWAYFNIKNNGSFFDASLTNIMTIGLAIFVSYYFTQKTNDKRKQKDIMLDLLLKLHSQIDSPDMYKLSSQEEEAITMRIRDINNRITILEDNKYGFFSKKDLNFIRTKFEEYRTLIGDHIDNMEYLIQSEKELKRPLVLLSTMLVDMEINIYK